MDVPLELTFREVEETPELDELIAKEVKKLGQICNYMNSCRIAVENRQKHQESGNPYRVRIDVTVPPSHELVVKNKPNNNDMHDPLEVVIHDTFQSMQRRLKKLTEKQREHNRGKPERKW